MKKNNLITEADKIVIIDLLYLGDLLFTTPFIRNLRQNNPQAQIDMVVNANFYDIIEDNPYLDQVYAYDKNWGLKESWQFAWKLSQHNYDLGLNIHGNWRTAMLLRVINPNYTVGFGGKGRGLWLDQELEPKEDIHMVEVYLEVLKDLEITEVDDEGLELEVNKEAQKNMKSFLTQAGVKEDDQLIGLNTGGSWPTKRWTTTGFTQLADRLQEEHNSRVIFFGGPGDVERVESIVAQMNREPIIAAGKTTLKELVALAHLCDLFISGDSGPIHVAASVGTPTIAIFGPSDETKYRPYGRDHQVVKTNLDCRPCGEHHCPLDHHGCMEEISPTDILDKLEI